MKPVLVLLSISDHMLAIVTRHSRPVKPLIFPHAQALELWLERFLPLKEQKKSVSGGLNSVFIHSYISWWLTSLPPVATDTLLPSPKRTLVTLHYFVGLLLVT